MEKKNTILLTVIAVATLLVAVIGATFAYFTASVSTQNDTNNTTTVKTKTLASAVMDLGSEISSSENVYPGFKTYRTVTVTGSGTADAEPINTNIVLTPSVTDFGSHIKWTLYKVATDSVTENTLTCEESNIVRGTVTDEDVSGTIYSYYDAMTCDTTNAGTAVQNGTFSGTTPVNIPVSVTSTTKDTYYLLVEYENDPNGEQDAEQGKTFTVTIGFVPQA